MKILYRADRDTTHLLTTALMLYEMFILFKIFFRKKNIYLKDIFKKHFKYLFKKYLFVKLFL